MTAVFFVGNCGFTVYITLTEAKEERMHGMIEEK